MQLKLKQQIKHSAALLDLDKYLLKLLPHERNMITKLRCNNIKLPIETGRWPTTPREERICHLCNVKYFA